MAEFPLRREIADMKWRCRRWNVSWPPQTTTALSLALVSACLLKAFVLFEAVINAIHRGAPAAAIAFNTRPDDSADAAARWLPPR